MRKVSNFDIFASHAWYVPGVGGMFALLAWFMLGSILGSILQLLVPAPLRISYGMLISYPVSFLPAMLYSARKSRTNSLFEAGYKLESSHFGPYKPLTVAIITIALAFGTIISADLPNYLNFKLTMLIPGMDVLFGILKNTLQAMTGGPLWCSFLLTAVFAPFFEEWLCRGMVLRGLLTKMKPWWAIVISALFFALIHMNPWQALNAFIIGLVMGVVYYRTGSLLLTMLIHFVNNALSVVLSRIPDFAAYDFLIDMTGRGRYALLYIAGLALLAGGLWLIHRIPLQDKRGNIDLI